MTSAPPRPPPPVLPRWLTVLLVISVVVNVALGAGFVIVGAASIANSDSIRAGDIRQCQANNTSRAQDIAIWNRLLNVPPTARSAETAAQKAEVADLERLVRIKDTPRNCSAAFRK